MFTRAGLCIGNNVGCIRGRCSVRVLTVASFLTLSNSLFSSILLCWSLLGATGAPSSARRSHGWSVRGSARGRWSGTPAQGEERPSTGRRALALLPRCYGCENLDTNKGIRRPTSACSEGPRLRPETGYPGRDFVVFASSSRQLPGQ